MMLSKKVDHQKWLAKHGLLPSQITQRKKELGQSKPCVHSSVSKPYQGLSNKIDGNGLRKGVMANLHKETKEVQKEILAKAKRCASLFNKGGIQYIVDGTLLNEIGKK